MIRHFLHSGAIFSQRVSFQPGDFLLRLGDTDCPLYWLECGCISTCPAPSAHPAAYEEVLEAPVLLGSSHLLDGRCRHMVQALSACEARLIERHHLLACYEQQPKLHLFLLRRLCQETLLTLPHYE